MPKTSDCYQLSIIIPFRSDDKRGYLVDRLRDFCRDIEQNEDAEYILVDSGSNLSCQQENQKICASMGVRYLYHDSIGEVFSIGSARDYGVQKAKGKLVTFLDVDLVPCFQFVKKLLEFSELSGVIEGKKRFFVVPCLYLTEYGSSEFLNEEKRLRHRKYLYKHTVGDGLYIENLAPCSSVMVVNRFHYLSIGGHHPQFKGHGYEDFELIHRLSAEEGSIPRSYNYYKDMKKWGGGAFNGFRAHFSLLGIPALKDGLCVAHLWHPRPVNTAYTESTKNNHLNAIAYFEKYDNEGIHPPALPSLESCGIQVLVFGEPETEASECIRGLIPHLGNIIYSSEYHFKDNNEIFSSDILEKFIQYKKIDRILFSNPYANPLRMAIYQWTKNNSFPFYCFERGALTDSWFVDETGFNVDSSKYDEGYWQKSLSEYQLSSISEYIQDALQSNEALEEQGERLTKEALSNMLKTGGRKVLFVPFQRPNDTVIKHFSGSAQSVENFAKQIDMAAKSLKAYGWDVVCKKHPLENITPMLEYARWVDSNIHFLDLVNLSDAVALINSGVGVYSMMMEKPCYIFGDAFYSHYKLNKEVKDSLELVDFLINNSFSVCPDTMFRFIYYLRNSYYSYGVPKTYIRNEKDGSKSTITKGISFYRINIPEKTSDFYRKPGIQKISLKAPLLERYAYHIWQQEEDERRIFEVSIQTQTLQENMKWVKKELIRKRDWWKFKTWFNPSSKVGKRFKKIVVNPKNYCLDSKFKLLKSIGKRLS